MIFCQKIMRFKSQLLAYTNNIKHKHNVLFETVPIFIYSLSIYFSTFYCCSILTYKKNLSLLVRVMSSEFSILASTVTLHYWTHSIFENLTFVVRIRIFFVFNMFCKFLRIEFQYWELGTLGQSHAHTIFCIKRAPKFSYHLVKVFTVYEILAMGLTARYRKGPLS